MSLFKLQSREEAIEGSTPLQGAKIAVPSEEGGIVNVVSEFPWTLSPKGGRKDVPYLYMIERRITNDVLLQQLVYNITALFNEGQTIPEELVNLVQNKLKLETTTTRKLLSEDEVRLKTTPTDSKESPYTGLYALEDTGWQFVLPYFDRRHHNINNDWGEPEKKGIGGLAATATEGIVEGAAASLNQIFAGMGSVTGEPNMRRVGTYIERAKQYKFPSSGPSYSVQFDLYNTQTIEDVIRNWELCFLLMYNTLPNRLTKTTFDPPPLYEIEIPGVRRSPVSFIKSIRVDFIGATRIMDLDLSKSIGNSQFRAIVPDAYSVTIEFQDVLPESKNFMNGMIDPDKDIRVTFDKTPSAQERESFSLDDSFSDVEQNGITHVSISKQQNPSGKKIARGTKDMLSGNISKAVNKIGSTGNRIVKETANALRGVF